MDDEEMFRGHRDEVYRVFANKLQTPSEVDDLIQATFVRYFSADRDGVRDPRRYLLTIAYNVLRGYWRRRAREAPHASFEDFSIADLATGVSTLLGRNERHRVVLEGLRHLRLEQQSALELYYWEGYKYREIAEILDLPPGTVATLISTGKQKLKAHFEAALGLSSSGEELDATLRGGAPPKRNDAD